jgi:ElaB/YqjD/DUF883 family membrane-anchored ribosome-binding protein
MMNQSPKSSYDVGHSQTKNILKNEPPRERDHTCKTVGRIKVLSTNHLLLKEIKDMGTNTLQDSANEVRKMSGVAIGAAEHLGNELRSSARQVGSAIRDAGSAVSTDVGTVAHDSYNSMLASGREGARQIESKVQESPLMAIGIAFGIGLLTSAFLSRRA